ncbi:hypothetical protein BaRGS_00031814 [Batillaria attramentaria]|uniref:Uncharacterized protein n=1 Tax=Batillaria attramentaria TaxID=370345 RepID=A0ABD0JQJ4_9CAEN
MCLTDTYLDYSSLSQRLVSDLRHVDTAKPQIPILTGGLVIMVNRGTCDRPLPDQQPVLVRCLCVCCILGILAATWSICLLRRCNRHLRLIVRFAAGHYLANDVMKTCLTLAALYYPVDLEAPKTDHGIVGSNQLLYWLLISSWQNLVSLLLLAILTRYPQIGYDYAILFIVTSWAFAPMPTLGVVTPYYRDGGPSCDRPSLWHPMVTGHNHLIISVPRAILQVQV